MGWLRFNLIGGLVLLAGCRTGSVAPPRAAAAPPAATTAAAPLPARSSAVSPPPSPIVQTAATAALDELNSPKSDVRIVMLSDLPTVATATTAAFADPPPAAELISAAESMPAAASQPQAIRLDLVGAIETSLRQNPDLVALRQNEGVGRGVLGVAQTYPFNPYVQIQGTPYQNMPVGGPGTMYHYVLLMQTIQLGHQQRFREESAAAALTSVRWNIHQAELLNLAQTERLFFTALYQRGVRDLVLANSELNSELLRVLERQHQAGQASAADVAIVRLDNRTTKNQVRLAEATYQTSLLDLRRQLNLPIDSPLEPVGDLTTWQWRSPTSEDWQTVRCANPCVTSDPPSALGNLVAGRPDVMAARADLAAARANARLAQGSRRPDLQAGPYYERDDFGTTYLGFRAQSDVPVINNGLPLLRQREAEVGQRQVVWQQSQIRAQLEAQAAIDRYERARRFVAESSLDFRDTLPAELQRLEEQFKAGEVDILRVFAARTSFIQLRRAHLDTLNELAQAAAVVSSATGLSAEALIAVEPPPKP